MCGQDYSRLRASLMSATPPVIPRPSARDRIVETAFTLFYRDGIRVTGIDKIIAESSVAKMSFYRYFPSKNDLITECLRRRSEEWLQWFTAAVEKKMSYSVAGMEIIADILRRWFEQPGFRGCAITNALVEMPAPEPEIQEVIRRHQAALEACLTDVAIRLDHADPRQTAAAVMVIMEGAIIRAQITGDPAVSDTCATLLKRFGRGVRKPDPVAEAIHDQLFLPGIGL